LAWALAFANRLTLTHWRADVRGGLGAAAVALPMGLAFGVVSGAGPVAGLYSAVWTGLFAALFGGTATQIAGPTGPIAIVMASVLLQFSAQPAAAFAVVVMAGLMQIAFGWARFGRYVNLMPYQVISGFACAVGCIIILMQMNPLMGQAGLSDTWSAARALPESIATANPATVAIAVACFAACQWLPRWARQVVPVHLSVLVVGTLITALLRIDIPHLPAPSSVLPHPLLTPLAELPWRDMWLSALVLALISSLDSLVTSISADNATLQFHDSNRELVGQGIGNVVAGLLGALPGSGSTFRTMANIRGGGRTPLSGVVHSLSLLMLVLAAGHLIQFVPACVLSGILIYIAAGIIDWAYIGRFPRAPREGVIVMVTVWTIGLFFNVVTAVAVGVIVTSLAFVKKMADLQLASLEMSADGEQTNLFTAEERKAYEDCGDDTLFIRLSGPLTFGAANGLTKRLAVVRRHKSVVLDFADVPHVDESTMIALESVIQRARENSQTIILVGLKSAVVRAFVRFGLLGSIKQCHRFRKRVDALRYAAKANIAAS
jgi:SulP family sulfate permease